MDLTSSFLVLSEINSKHVYIIHLNEVSGPECELESNFAFIQGRLQTTLRRFAFPRMQNQLPSCGLISFYASPVAIRMKVVGNKSVCVYMESYLHVFSF